MITRARLAAYGVLLAALAACAWIVHRWHEQAQRVPQLEAALEQARAEQAAYKTEVERQIRIAQESSNAYQAELARLRARPTPHPIRVCVAPDVPTAQPHAGAPGGPDAAGPGGGLVQEAPGRDIGPELYALADDADRCAAQLRGLQSWIRGVTPPGR